MVIYRTLTHVSPGPPYTIGFPMARPNGVANSASKVRATDTSIGLMMCTQHEITPFNVNY